MFRIYRKDRVMSNNKYPFLFGIVHDIKQMGIVIEK